MQKLLILCTGNSCRSILAEALINHLGSGQIQAFSAGSHPKTAPHLEAIATLRRHNIPVGHPTSKSWQVFENESFDLIITVCDQVAEETCPILPGQPQQWHWSLPDPAKISGTKVQIEASFDTVFQELKARIETELLLSTDQGNGLKTSGGLKTNDALRKNDVRL